MYRIHVATTVRCRFDRVAAKLAAIFPLGPGRLPLRITVDEVTIEHDVRVTLGTARELATCHIIPIAFTPLDDPNLARIRGTLTVAGTTFSNSSHIELEAAAIDTTGMIRTRSEEDAKHRIAEWAAAEALATMQRLLANE